MKFEEVFNSGFKFRLPKGFDSIEDQNTWPENFWWWKCDDEHFYYQDFNYDNIRYKEHISEVPNLYLKTNEWYLDPEGEKVYKFKDKLEGIVNEE